MKQLIILGLIIISGSVSASANIKVKSKQTMSGQSYENTTYIKGKRQRAETMNGAMVNITQCDLRRAVQLNPATKTFVVTEFGEVAPADQTAPGSIKNQPVTKGGKIISTITVKDTGERKNMFGFTARHLIITMDTDSTPDACSPTKSKMQTDGWYIDLDFAFDCDQTYAYRPTPNAKNGGCQDKYEMKTIGTAKRGFPVYEKTIFFDESGRETMSMINEVVELSKSPLETALFEVPTDYRQVTDASEMYATASTSNLGTGSMSMGGGSDSMSSMPLTNSGASMQQGEIGNETLGAKKAGTIRIGLAVVKTGAVGEGITAADLASAVRNTMLEFLKVPNIEVVPLDARLASAIDAEASEKECDLVVHTTVSHKKGGGGGFGKMFGSALGSAVSMAGVGGGTGGYIAGQVASQAITTAAMSSQFKSKDELTLDIMVKRDGSSALAKVYKAKAKSNGDDLISQIVEQAATNIVEIAGK